MSFALWYALSPETGKGKFADMTVSMQSFCLIGWMVQMHPVRVERLARSVVVANEGHARVQNV